MARQIFRHPSGLGPNHQDPVSAPPPGLRDPDRLAALYRTALLDSPPDAAFDRLTALATRLTGAPIALVTLIDERRQFFKSCVGLPEPWCSDRESGLEFSICKHVVGSGEPLIVPDAREHPLLSGNAVVATAGVIAYAGLPLVTSDGFCLGTFCLMDRRPRAWTEDELALLADLAALAVARVELQVSLREREGACAEAEASAAELHGIMSAIGEVVLILDRDGRYLAVGPNAHERLARPAQALIGRTVHEIFDAGRADQFRELIERAIDGNVIAEAEYDLTIDGRVYWSAASVSRLDDRRVVWVARDITARKAAEEALRTSQRLMQQVLQTLPIGVWVLDQTGRITYGNEAGRQIWAGARYVEPGEFGEYRGWWAETGEAVAPQEWGAARALLHGETSHGELIDIECFDGTRKTILHWGVPIRGRDGTIEGAIAVNQDVTDARRAEQALRDSEERYRIVARATQDVVYDYDIASGGVYWNDAVCTVFRYPPEEIESEIGWWTARIHADDLDRVSGSIAAALAREDESWTQEYRFRRADGSFATVLDRSFILRDVSGRAIRMIGSMVDLTERTRLEEQLRQAQKMEAIGQLAGGVAHDFNNLLAAIAINASLLHAHVAPGAAGQELAEIEGAAERGAGLIRQLLAYSRRQVLQLRLLDLNRVVEETETLLRRVLDGEVTLETRLASGLGTVLADPGQVTQVLLNFAVNARDAMPRGGRLTITTANATLGPDARRRIPGVEPGDYVALTVADTGVGMDAETMARAFEPFFTTKEAGKGTGMGLATVYGIVDQSGGHVYAESRVGEGSTFTVLLPRRAGTPAGGGSPPPAHGGLPRGTETVLLVEDEDSVRSSVARALKRHGYEVIEATNGHEALALLDARAEPVALVLTDVMMPGMGGRELAEHLRTGRPALPVLFMSGYDAQSVATHGTLPDGAALVEKPFTMETLLRQVRATLDASPRSARRD